MFRKPFAQTIALILLMQFTATIRADDKHPVLFDFSQAAVASEWHTVNDGVMGGISVGKVAASGNVLEFFGTLSLENNGGFASVRSKTSIMDLSSYDGLVFRIRGDGRSYYLNIRVPTEQIAFSYRASFTTKAGKWIEVKIPFADLKATAFGKVLEQGEPLNPGNVEAVGFLLADKQAGPFKLEIAWIKGSPKTTK